LSHVERCLKDTRGPVIASSDYVRLMADQIRAYVPRRYVVLGTDGFGRSDTRERLRHFFEVNRHWVVLTALKALADEGGIERGRLAEAMSKYDIDAGKPAPWTV
jgi:pyruvate dehydrogenase E1 component